jgi:hypothetical protein
MISYKLSLILRDCALSNAVWIECNRVIHKLSIAKDDGLWLFERLMAKLADDDLTLVTCVA